MDGPSFPSLGYTLAGAAPAEIRLPAARKEADAAPTPDPTASKPHAAAQPASSPAFVVEFSEGVSGGYVLDCRDPKTNAVLVQVPMRSVFTQMEGAATPEHVGKHVDTTA